MDAVGAGANGVLERYLAVDQNYYLPDDILYKTDRMSMAHSLEVRPPFLDHADRGVRGVAAAALKIRGFKQKYVLQELMRGQAAGDGAERGRRPGSTFRRTTGSAGRCGRC